MSVFGRSSTKASVAAIGVATASFVGAIMLSPSDATPSNEATTVPGAALK
jgi:hypothetical protein